MKVKRYLPTLIKGYAGASFEHELIRDIGRSYIFIKHNRISLAAILFSIYHEKTFITIKYLIKILLQIRQLSIIKCRKVIVATDHNSAGYFHWYLDVLTRLTLLEEYKEYTLLLPKNYNKNTYIIESLDFMGFNYNFVDGGSILLKADVITAIFEYPSGNYNPEIVKGLRNKLYIQKDIPNRLVYISRAKAQRRRMISEENFTEKLIKLGFEVIYCENLSFYETRSLFSSVRILIAQHGAGLTNMLFMQPKATVIEIRKLGDEHNNCYFSLASALDINYEYCTTKEMGGHNDYDNFDYENLIKHLKNK